MPPELGRLGALKRLWLDRNRLQTVPRELTQLTSLQEIYLVSLGLQGGRWGAVQCKCSAVLFPALLHLWNSRCVRWTH